MKHEATLFVFVWLFVILSDAQDVYRGRRGLPQGFPSLCSSQWTQLLPVDFVNNVEFLDTCSPQLKSSSFVFNGAGTRVLTTGAISVVVPPEVQQVQLVFDLFAGDDSLSGCEAAPDNGVFQVSLKSPPPIGNKRLLGKFVGGSFRKSRKVVISLRFNRGTTNVYEFKFSQLGFRRSGVWSVSNIAIQFACTPAALPSVGL